MKLNWFSLLPPLATAASACTTRLLPFLAEAAEVVLWTDQPTWDRRLEQLAEVRSYNPVELPPTNLGPDAVNIYHMSNDGSNAGLWRLSQKQPGVMVLHELQLARFYRDMLCQVENDPDRYVATLREHHGEAGAWAAEGTAQHTLCIDRVGQYLPATNLALGRSLGVVVSSFKGWRAVQRFRRWPVCRLDPHLAPQRYVCRLLDFAAEVCAARHSPAARAIAATVSTLLAEWGDGPALEALRAGAEDALFGLA
jgi:hypothetical protein